MGEEKQGCKYNFRVAAGGGAMTSTVHAGSKEASPRRPRVVALLVVLSESSFLQLSFCVLEKEPRKGTTPSRFLSES